MSDLWCPATLLLVRHAEAEYDEPDVAGDNGGWLTALGRRQAAALAEALTDRRVAAVWCSDLSRAVQTAEIVAAALHVSVRVRRGLREASVGGYAGQPDPATLFDSFYLPWLAGSLDASPPDGETGADVVRRVRSELESAADQFRGETVLVVSHAGALGVTVPLVVRNVPADYARDRPLMHCAVCEVTADADGWIMRSWNGEPVDSRVSCP